jgi:hypothetical protein
MEFDLNQIVVVRLSCATANPSCRIGLVDFDHPDLRGAFPTAAGLLAKVVGEGGWNVEPQSLFPSAVRLPLRYLCVLL